MAKKNPKTTSVDSTALAAAADQESTPNQLCKLAEQSPELARIVAANPAINASVVGVLKKQKDPKVNRALAANPGTPMSDLLELGERYTSEFVQNPIFDLALAADPRFIAKFPQALLENILTNQQTPENIILWCIRNAEEFELIHADPPATDGLQVCIVKAWAFEFCICNPEHSNQRWMLDAYLKKRNNLSEELVNKLVGNSSIPLRIAIAERAYLSKELINKLMVNCEWEETVWTAMALRLDLSEEILRYIAYQGSEQSIRVLAAREDFPEDLFYIMPRHDSCLNWDDLEDFYLFIELNSNFGNDLVKNIPEDFIIILLDSISKNVRSCIDNENYDFISDLHIAFDDYSNELPQWAIGWLTEVYKELPSEAFDNLIEDDDSAELVDKDDECKIVEPSRTFDEMKALHGHMDISLETVQALAKNSDRYVRCAIAQRSDLSLNLIRELSKDTQACVRGAIAQRADIPDDLVVSLAADLSWYVKCAIADRKSLPVNLLDEFLKDQDEFVSTFTRARIDLNTKSLSYGAVELDIEPIPDNESDDEDSNDEESDDEESDDKEKNAKKSPEEIYYEHPYHRISSRRRIYLSGKTVVIFGLSDEVSAELSARFKAAGAVIANNVSAKTNILVTNQAKTATPGTIRNAIAFGAEVWDEATACAKLSAQRA